MGWGKLPKFGYSPDFQRGLFFSYVSFRVRGAIGAWKPPDLHRLTASKDLSLAAREACGPPAPCMVELRGLMVNGFPPNSFRALLGVLASSIGVTQHRRFCWIWCFFFVVCVFFFVGWRKEQQQMSNEKHPGWLGYVGDYTSQSHRDYNKPL